MKPIQVMFDEELLARLDQTEEVRRAGRSAVLRRAAEDFLRRRRRYDLAQRYRQAYGEDSSLGEGFGDWGDQGEWPKG